MKLILNLHFEQVNKNATKFIYYFQYIYIFLMSIKKKLSKYGKIIRKYIILKFISHN